MPTIIIVLVAIVVLAFVVLSSTIKIVQEYERGVIFRLGRLVGARGPGLFFLIPGVERMRKVDLRIVTLEVPAQEAITRDNVTVKVNAVVYFRVVDPEEAVVKVLDYIRATSLIGQTTLRSILGQSDLDHLLSERDKINAELQQVIDTQTSAWGVKVTSVEVRDLELPQSMQRAMARQAEAEREKRAKVIHAEGEFSASQQLANAAQVIGSQPATLQLRYLQTLTEIAAEKNSTIVFLGTPIDDVVANLIVAQLLYLAQDDPDREIQMYINSPGGQMDAGLAIYDTMHLIQPQVATTCIGMAASTGALLLGGGAKGKRSALPNSRILIHQASAGFQGTASDIEVQAREIIRMNGVVDLIVGQTIATVAADRAEAAVKRRGARHHQVGQRHALTPGARRGYSRIMAVAFSAVRPGVCPTATAELYGMCAGHPPRSDQLQDADARD